MRDSLGIITGAAGGVGAACAERFAAEGWSLVLVDVDKRVKDVARTVGNRFKQSVVGVVANVADGEGVAHVDVAVKATGLPLRFLGLVAATQQDACAVEMLGIANGTASVAAVTSEPTFS